MPETLCDSDVKVVLAGCLRAFLQIGGTHDLEKDPAVNGVESRHQFHLCRGGMLFCSNFVHHILPHMPEHILLGKAGLLQCQVQRNAWQNGLRQRFHLVFRLTLCVFDQRPERFLLRIKQSAAFAAFEFLF